MKPITAQQIVDIIEARYAELEARQEATSQRGEYEDADSRLRELETVLNRISIGYGLGDDA